MAHVEESDSLGRKYRNEHFWRRGGGGGEGRNEFCAVGGYSEKNVSIDGKGGYLVSYKSKNDKELVREQ